MNGDRGPSRLKLGVAPHTINHPKIALGHTILWSTKMNRIMRVGLIFTALLAAVPRARAGLILTVAKDPSSSANLNALAPGDQVTLDITLSGLDVPNNQYKSVRSGATLSFDLNSSGHAGSDRPWRYYSRHVGFRDQPRSGGRGCIVFQRERTDHDRRALFSVHCDRPECFRVGEHFLQFRGCIRPELQQHPSQRRTGAAVSGNLPSRSGTQHFTHCGLGGGRVDSAPVEAQAPQKPDRETEPVIAARRLAADLDNRLPLRKASLTALASGRCVCDSGHPSGQTPHAGGGGSNNPGRGF